MILDHFYTIHQMYGPQMFVFQKHLKAYSLAHEFLTINLVGCTQQARTVHARQAKVRPQRHQGTWESYLYNYNGKPLRIAWRGKMKKKKRCYNHRESVLYVTINGTY